MKRNTVTKAVAALFVVAAASSAFAQKISDDVVKIGVLTDMSGTYSDLAGKGSVVAAEMAIEDYSKSKTVLGKKNRTDFCGPPKQSRHHGQQGP